MNCMNCGGDLSSDAKFCIICGTKVTETQDSAEAPEIDGSVLISGMEEITAQSHQKPVDLEAVSQVVVQRMDDVAGQAVELELKEEVQKHLEMSSPENKKKPKKIKKLLVILLTAILLVGGSFGAYYGYQAFLDHKLMEALNHFDNKSYEKAIQISMEYCDRNDRLQQKLIFEMGNRILQIKEDFMAEKVDYQTAIKKVGIVESIVNDRSIHLKVLETVNLFNEINFSRECFDKAKYYYAQGKYEDALKECEKTSSKDIHYTLAVANLKNSINVAWEIEEEKLELAKQEEEKRLEENKVKMKENTLEQAELLIKEYNYQAALEMVNHALETLSGDIDLIMKKETYEEYVKESIRVSELEPETFEKIFSLPDGEEIVNLYISIPMLHGNSPGYQIINEKNRSRIQIIKDNASELEGSFSFLTEDNMSKIPEGYFDDITFKHHSEVTVRLNDYGLISFIYESKLLKGGSTDVFTEGVVFDLASGEQVSLYELMKIDDDTFHEMVISPFLDLIAENPQDFIEDAGTVLQETVKMNTVKFYLMEDRISFLMPQELVRNGQEDTVDIMFEDVETLFAFLNQPNMDDSIVLNRNSYTTD